MCNKTVIATNIARLVFQYEDWSKTLDTMLESKFDSEEYKSAEAKHKLATKWFRECIAELAEEGIELDGFSFVR